MDLRSMIPQGSLDWWPYLIGDLTGEYEVVEFVATIQVSRCIRCANCLFSLTVHVTLEAMRNVVRV